MSKKPHRDPGLSRKQWKRLRNGPHATCCDCGVIFAFENNAIRCRACAVKLGLEMAKRALQHP